MDIERPKRTNSRLPDDLSLSSFSRASIDILEHFGIDAPNLLNNYSTALEDALIEQVQNRANDLKRIKRYEALLQEHQIPYKP